MQKFQSAFIAGSPIPNANLFIGRKTELTTIFGRLTNSAFESTQINGMYRVGKTSLMQMLRNEQMMEQYGLNSEKTCFGAYLDMQTLQKASPARFWKRVIDEVWDALASYDFKVDISHTRQVTRQEREAAEKKTEQSMENFRNILRAFSQDKLHFYLLCDEFDAVMQNPQMDFDFFGKFREFLQGPNFALVTASRRPLIELTHNEKVKTSPFFNIFGTVSLKGFNQEEMTDFIHRYQEFCNYQFNKEELDLMQLHGGRFPYFVQLLGQKIIALRLSNIEQAQFQAKAIETFWEDAASHFMSMWKSLKDEEQQALLTLIEGTKAEDEQTWKQAMGQLETMGLVHKDGDNFRIFSRSFRNWIVQQNLRAGLGDSELQHESKPFALTLFAVANEFRVKAANSSKQEIETRVEAQSLQRLAQITTSFYGGTSQISTEQIGKELFYALMPEAVQNLLPQNLEKDGIDLNILVQDLGLQRLSWEFLQDSRRNWIPAISENSQLMRYVLCKKAPPEPSLQRGLIISYVHEAYDEESHNKEINLIQRQFQAAAKGNEIYVFENPKMSEIETILNEWKPNFLHWMGGTKLHKQQLYLKVMDENQQESFINQSHLQSIISSLYLLSFNLQYEHLLSGMLVNQNYLHGLVGEKISLVVGYQMQEDYALRTQFFEQFYRGLAYGQKAGKAINAARRYLYEQHGETYPAWAAPVAIMAQAEDSE